MGGRKKISLLVTISSILLVVSLLGWLLGIIFEGEKPQINVMPLPEFLAGRQEFALTLKDMRRGLKKLEVAVIQEGREISVYERQFPFKGLLNRDGVHRFDTRFFLDPSKLNLAQGRVDLKVRVWDYSRRSGGDGNLSLFQHKIMVDTIPPAIRAVSRLNYINAGGAGLIVYQASSDTIKSGLYVNDIFFSGFPAHEELRKGLHVCYFAVPHDTKEKPEIYLWAEDRAGNRSRGKFHYNIRRKRFRQQRMNITDRFLERVLPYFSFYDLDADAGNIEKFLKINRDLRNENASVYYDLRTKTAPRQLWNGTWQRLKNAATMAGFGDRRTYYYKGDEIDRQVHLGVDLASLANAKVQAANHGLVIFADRLGIYGLTVILYHGQGLASIYSHLSKIDVKPDDEITKGEILGLTGQTGLAGGDHLHFGIMVGGVFVNPIEWWDSHWIQDNVTRKLARLKK